MARLSWRNTRHVAPSHITSEHFVEDPPPMENHNKSISPGIDDIHNDLLRMQRDSIAEMRKQYILPEPGQQAHRPIGINIDYCCENYGLEGDKYLNSLSFQSNPSDAVRKMWNR
jgi:hypothetical protein